MKIVTVIGARPQFIKAAAVSRELRSVPGAQEILLHTGQHYDANMSSVFFDELQIPAPDYNLNAGSGTQGAQTATMLKGIEEILMKEKPDRTLVYGDTNSTIAGALASVKLHIPVAHVEAGLRSFNSSMPEEINRIVTDRISDLLFAPTQTAVSDLQREGLGNATRLTGDVMYDSLLFYQSLVKNGKGRYSVPGIPGHYYLATIHRAENTDNPENLAAIFSGLEQIGDPIVLPVHPRTRKTIRGSIAVPENVRLIEPVGYLEMLWLIMGSYKILTDSGGLQKEAYFLDKPCITLRNETEWVETLHDGWNRTTGTNPERILDAAKSPLPAAPRKDAFGDGTASRKISLLLTGN